MSKSFLLNTKTILRWTGDEEKLKKVKKGSKRMVTMRKVELPPPYIYFLGETLVYS